MYTRPKFAARQFSGRPTLTTTTESQHQRYQHTGANQLEPAAISGDSNGMLSEPRVQISPLIDKS